MKKIGDLWKKYYRRENDMQRCMKISTRMVRMKSGYIINEIMKNIIKFVQEFEILIMLIYIKIILII